MYYGAAATIFKGEPMDFIVSGNNLNVPTAYWFATNSTVVVPELPEEPNKPVLPNTVSAPYILPQDLVFFSNTYRHKIQAVCRIIITLKTYFLSSWQIFTCHILFSSKYLTACSLFFAISSRRLSKLSNIFSGRRNSCSSSFSFLP